MSSSSRSCGSPTMRTAPAWEAPPEVRERVKAEVARIRGVAAVQPRLQHAAFLTLLAPL